MRKRFLVLSLLAILASCGGGGGSVPSVPAGAAGGPVQGGHATAKVVFSITVPASRGRKPATVSPSTQSVTIAVNGAAPQAFNIALTAAGCGPGSSGPVSCGFTLNVPVGSDTFEVITWDTPGGSGHPLNVGDSIVTIVANQTNTVPLTLTTWAVANLNDAGAGSLRQILTGASSGDTIGFAVRGQINVVSTALTAETSVGLVGPLFGPAVVLDGGGINTILSVGGSGLTVALSNLTLQHGTGITGGAIDNPGNNTLTLNTDSFLNNTASGSGGAIYAAAAGTLTLTNSTLTSNTAGGAGNVEGGAIWTGGALTMSNDTLSNNSAVQSTGNSAFGGAMWIDAASTAVALTNLQVTGNSAVANGACCGQAEGGAIFWFSNVGTLSSSTLSNNTASSAFSCECISSMGGGIYIPNSSSATLTDVTMQSNTTTNSGGGVEEGGAIYNAGTLTIHSGTFQSNSTDPGNNDGGAIYSTNTLSLDNGGTTGNPLFKQNTSGNGGGLGVCSGSPTTVSNATFNANTATQAGTGAGGAIDMSCGTMSITGSTFTNNTADNLGGAIEFNSNPGTITNSTFTSNAVTGTNLNDGAGAVDLDNGSEVVNNDTFTSNTSTSHGGALTDYSGVAGNEIIHCTFTNNSAVLGGGAIQDTSGEIISASTFSGNSVTGTYDGVANFGGLGGALITSWTTSVAESTFDSNTATSAGGAIFINSANLVNVTNTTISNNTVTAGGYGGAGIFVNNVASVSGIIVDDTFYHNTAPQAFGGAIYNAAASALPQAVTVDFSTFANNSANACCGGLGGGIYNNSIPALTPASIGRHVLHHGPPRAMSARRRTMSSPLAMLLDNSLFQANAAQSGADLYTVAVTSSVDGDYDFFAATLASIGAPFATGGSHNGYGINALLGPLQINAPGVTKTMAPAAGSPINNVIPSPGPCDESIDQRGVTRPEGGFTQCTPGAYEYP